MAVRINQSIFKKDSTGAGEDIVSRYGLDSTWRNSHDSNDCFIMSFFVRLPEPNWQGTSTRQSFSLIEGNDFTNQSTGLPINQIMAYPVVTNYSNPNTGWYFIYRPSLYLADYSTLLPVDPQSLGGLVGYALNFNTWYGITLVSKYRTYTTPSGYTHPIVDYKVYIDGTLRASSSMTFFGESWPNSYTNSANGLSGWKEIGLNTTNQYDIDRLWIGWNSASKYSGITGSTFHTADAFVKPLGTGGATSNGATPDIYSYGTYPTNFWNNRGDLSASGLVYANNTDFTNIDGRPLALEDQTFISNTQNNFVGGYRHFGVSSQASEVQSNLIGKNNISGVTTTITSNINVPDVVAANTVGFPNPLYVDDTYVDDSYVGIVFDAVMEQTFSTRNTMIPFGGYKIAGVLSADSDSQTALSSGLIFDEDSSMLSQNVFNSLAGRLLSTNYTFDSVSQFNSLGGNAIEGVLSMLSDSQASGTATVEIIPDANIFADSQIQTIAGYLQTSGALTLGTDVQYIIDQTLGSTAGIRFNGEVSVASATDTITAGGLNFSVSTNLDFDTATNIVAGYFDNFAATISADHQTTIVPTLLRQTAQARVTSSHQTNFLLNVKFTARDTNINTDTQTTIAGRILQAVDPYRAIDIASELRTIIVQAEMRDEQLNSESRINKINQETRAEKMQSETRVAEIFNDKTIIQRSSRRVGDRI